MPRQQRPQVRAARPQRSASIVLRSICPATHKGPPDFLYVAVPIPIPVAVAVVPGHGCAQRSLPCLNRCLFRLLVPPPLAVSVYRLLFFFLFFFLFSCFSFLFLPGRGTLSGFAKNGILAVRALPVVRTGIETCPNIEPAPGFIPKFYGFRLKTDP